MIRVNLEPRISMQPVYIDQGVTADVVQTRTFDEEGQPPTIHTRLHVKDENGNTCSVFNEGVWTYWILEMPMEWDDDETEQVAITAPVPEGHDRTSNDTNLDGPSGNHLPIF